MKKHIFQNKKKSLASGVALGLLSSVLSFLVLMVIAALVLSKLQDPLGMISLFSLVTLVLAAPVSSLITVKTNYESGVRCSIISAAVISLAILAVGLVCGGGAAAFPVLLNSLSYMLASLLFSYLFSGKKKKRFLR